MLQEARHIKNTVVFVFQHVQCLHLINSEVTWALVSSGTQVQSQIIVDPDYFPDYLSASYSYASAKHVVEQGYMVFFVRQKL